MTVEIFPNLHDSDSIVIFMISHKDKTEHVAITRTGNRSTMFYVVNGKSNLRLLRNEKIVEIYIVNFLPLIISNVL